MQEYINYFKEYFTEYHDGYDYEVVDGVFKCKFVGDPLWGRGFKFTLLEKSAYDHMKEHDVLDRYLEIMKLRYADTNDESFERLRSHEYDYYEIDKEILDKRDQWMPYLHKDRVNAVTEVAGFDIIVFTEGKRQTKLSVYKYDDKESCYVDTSIKYYGEIEYIDEVLSRR